MENIEDKILLESGNNEVEILSFSCGKNGCTFGINVSKVSEVIKYFPVTFTPNSHEAVAGVLKPRSDLLTAIDLRKFLYGENPESYEGTMMIITNFNEQNLAFIVDSVYRIKRFNWHQIIKPNGLVSSSDSGCITGIIQDEDKLINILDFEKIVTDINPELGLKVSEVDLMSEERKEEIKKRDIKVMIAEDSQMLNAMLKDTLVKAGFDVVSCNNGQEAYNQLEILANSNLLHTISLLITDIEMPEMDGITLSKKIKTDAKFGNLPIIVFSSLVNDALRRKIADIGIEDTVTKPEIGSLISKCEKILGIAK